jgi:acetyl-CoA carboxylase biotin carboxylase subunit
MDKVLIANRGEIAVRIIRALKTLNMKSVAVYSTADKDGLWVKMANESICIGPPKSSESYLNTRNIITAALNTHCKAIHPGVGFLSENDAFAKEVEDSGLIFIGPSSSTIALLGDKIQARILAQKAGIPVTPGGFEPIKNIKHLKSEANRIGYPVILKAAFGGGGKGMRIVNKEEELESNFNLAKSEAKQFFGNDTIHIERFLTHPRHIEIQLLSDGKDHVIFLGDRDCTVQKNHQKLIEESPSTVVDEKLRDQLKTASIKLFKEIHYKGAGTIEFLLEDNLCCFMEVNARIQVEHPVSEMVSSMDLIVEMIKIAFDIPSSLLETNPTLSGHSMEVRINALSCGKITKFNPPLGPFVRCDTHLYTGFNVSPFYDSMLLKLIVSAPTRLECIDRMIVSLKELEIEGIKTNMQQSINILNNNKFRSGKYDTSLYKKIEKEII